MKSALSGIKSPLLDLNKLSTFSQLHLKLHPAVPLEIHSSALLAFWCCCPALNPPHCCSNLAEQQAPLVMCNSWTTGSRCILAFLSEGLTCWLACPLVCLLVLLLVPHSIHWSVIIVFFSALLCQN